MKKAAPSASGGNRGRDMNGRFSNGNAGGPGNPHARRVNQLRTMLLKSVSDDELRTLLRALVRKAQAGDLAAIDLLLNRMLGKNVSFTALREG